VINRQNTPRLHKHKTDWEKYREDITNMNLQIKLKNSEDLDLTIERIIKVMQQAATHSTPPLEPQKRTKNISLDIKELSKEKRNARAIWQRNHIPTEKTTCNELTNKLKPKLKELREASFTEYIQHLNRHDYSIWKPIKNRREPRELSPPIRETTPIAGPWARSNKGKSELFAKHFVKIFTPHNDARDQEKERNTAAPTGIQQTLSISTPKEITETIKSLGLKKHLT
jgi:hypothetical protein